MDFLSFMSSFKCFKNFPLKTNFSENNFLEVYADVHYSKNIIELTTCRFYGESKRLDVDYHV